VLVFFYTWTILICSTLIKHTCGGCWLT